MIAAATINDYMAEDYTWENIRDLVRKHIPDQKLRGKGISKLYLYNELLERAPQALKKIQEKSKSAPKELEPRQSSVNKSPTWIWLILEVPKPSKKFEDINELTIRPFSSETAAREYIREFIPLLVEDLDEAIVAHDGKLESKIQEMLSRVESLAYGMTTKADLYDVELYLRKSKLDSVD